MKFLNDLTFVRTTGIDFTTSTSDVRKLFWDEDNHTLSIEMGGDVVQQIGEEQFVMAKNLTASPITNGTLVSTVGSLGETGRAIVEPSLGSGPYDASCITGLVTENIPAGGDGIVTSFGLVRNLDTTGASVGETWLEGDKLYIHPTISGAMTKVFPQAPNLKVFIGRVMYVDATNGSIFVCVQRGSYLGQDHNVEFTNLLDGELIQYNGTSQRWENINVESLSFNASQSLVEDIGNYYTASNVEGALQEIGNSLANVVDTNDTSSVVAGTSTTVSSVTTGNNTEYTVNHADTSTLSGAQGSNGIASISVDGLGHVTSVTPATYLTAETPDFNTIVITDTDSGYAWNETGSIVADQVNDSATFVSGVGIDLDVSPDADAIRISNTGVTSAVSGTGVNVSSATGTVTFSHGDTSTQASINNSGNTFIQDVTLDDYGHITGMVSGTVVESNAFSNIAVSGQNTIAADSTADTLTLIAGDNTTITTDSVNDSVTINSVDTVTRVSGTAGTPVSGDILVQGTGLISTSQSGNTITIATTANNYSHPTQTAITSDNSSGTVIQDISVNTLGHVTSVGTVNLDGRYYTETEVDNLLSAKQSTSEKGAANGYASLDAAGLVPASQLPSYVDDVLEYATLEDFPTTGTAGKIYIALDTNKTYRWSGTVYVYITSGAVDSVDGRTGVVSLSSVYEPKNTNIQTHILSTTNPHSVTASQVGLGNVTNESKATMFTSPVFTGTPTAPTAVVNTNTTQLATTAFVNAEIANDAAPKSHVGETGTAHGLATTSVNGFMSSSDKTKLDGIDTGANNYTHPASHPPSIIAQDASNRFVTDTEKSTWNAKASTSVVTTSSNGLMAFADKIKLDGIATGAEVNQSAFSNIAVSGQTTVAADAKTDTLTLVAGSNVTITTDATADTITIASTDTNTTYTASTGLTMSGTDIRHVDTSTQSSLTALTGANVVSDIDLDTYGHVTALATRAMTAADIGASASTHNHTLDGLSNTTITSNSAGEILKWNGTTWVNNTLAEAGIQPAGSYLTGNQTITLSGDVSGSGTTSISVTVADDSHNHIISNVDGLQDALDGKASSSHTHTMSQITDIGTVAAINTNASTEQYLRGDGTWATPPSVDFGDWTISQDPTTSSLKFIYG